jgi:hypothetical protein
MSADVDDFLAHYGVLGMKWGHHKAEESGSGGSGSAKPDVQVKREAKAQKYLAKADAFQTKINEINSQNHNWFTRGQAAKDVKDLTKLKEQAIADAERKRQGKLSANQKKVLIGAIVAGSIIAALAINHGVQSGNFQRAAVKGKAFMTGREFPEFKKNPELAKAMTPDLVHSKIVKDINPNYGAIGSKVNCRRCTFAYEMRRRGMDVKATRTTNGYGQNAAGFLNAVTPGQKTRGTGTSSVIRQVTREKAGLREGKASPLMTLGAKYGENEISLGDSKIHKPQAIFDALAKQPNGSRGELSVKWTAGGAHSMAYEIFDGKPVIFDTQTGEKLDTLGKMGAHGLIEVSKAGFTRLDNKDLNKDYLLRWVKNK